MLGRLHKIGAAHRPLISETPRTKQEAELAFWRKEILRYVDWYQGILPTLYQTPAPLEKEKIRVSNIQHSSILTWHRLHQEVKYLANLALAEETFSGMRVLDVGAGPMASATCFKGADLYCLEPLLPRYLDAGFPIHYHDHVKFICAPGENIPLPNGFLDAVISVNAIDHVDNIAETATEIRRVLKPGGYFRMHVHYHPPATCEPLKFNDELFLQHFGWSPGLRKVYTGRKALGWELPPDQTFVLWSNFGE